LRWALEEARLRGSKLQAVYAWLPPQIAGRGSIPLEFLHPELLRQAARDRLESFVAEVARSADVELESVALQGPAAKVLVEAAEEADLLVVGSRGHGGFAGLLLGSVGQQCAQHARCPVGDRPEAGAEGRVMHELLVRPAALFADRSDAGRALAAELESEQRPGLIVVGLARGGVEVAAEIARVLAAPLEVVAVRKIGHPLQPEYGIGAVAPGDGVYVRGPDGLTDEEVAVAVEKTKAKAALLDRRLHAQHEPLELAGKTALVVDDGLATGGTMIAALRWARAARAARVVAAVPVGAEDSLFLVRKEADDVVCLYPLVVFLAVGVWYRSFDQVGDEEVIRLLDENRRAIAAP
jgi:putative phosphoribosyl transferase